MPWSNDVRANQSISIPAVGRSHLGALGVVRVVMDASLFRAIRGSRAAVSVSMMRPPFHSFTLLNLGAAHLIQRPPFHSFTLLNLGHHLLLLSLPLSCQRRHEPALIRLDPQPGPPPVFPRLQAFKLAPPATYVASPGMAPCLPPSVASSKSFHHLCAPPMAWSPSEKLYRKPGPPSPDLARRVSSSTKGPFGNASGDGVSAHVRPQHSPWQCRQLRSVSSAILALPSRPSPADAAFVITHQQSLGPCIHTSKAKPNSAASSSTL